MNYDLEISLPERVPFYITDEIGEILVSSPPSIKKKNIFKSGVISPQDEMLVCLKACSAVPMNVIVKNEVTGKAMLAVGSMFSSTRTLLFLLSDIDFSVAAALANDGVFFSTVARNSEKNVTKREKENGYQELTELFAIKGILFPLKEEYCSFMESLVRKSSLIAKLCGCEADTKYSIIPRTAYNNFDISLFCLFLFIQFCVASAYSKTRKACLDINAKVAYLTINVTFEKAKTGKAKNNLMVSAKYFDDALNYFRAVSDRLNLPFSVGFGESPISSFSPIRRDVALLGLKSSPVLRDVEEERREKVSLWLSDIAGTNEET